MGHRTWALRERALAKLQGAMAHWEPAEEAAPPGGWIRAVRVALGMSSRQLAARVGVAQATLESAQRAEVAHSISLATLERYAAGMRCRLVYALVPLQGTLASMREQRADLIAFERIWMSGGPPQRDPDEAQRVDAYVQGGLLFKKGSRLWEDASLDDHKAEDPYDG